MATMATDDDLDSWPTTFALRLRDLRLRAGLSQQQLADFSTLSVRTIRDIENGRVAMPRQGTCELLISALNDGTPRPMTGPARRPEARAVDLEPVLEPGPPRGTSAGGPFVGRDDELAALAGLNDGEHFRLITVAGVEGVGKTRLCAEFARRLRAAEETTVLWLTAAPGRPGARRLRDAVPDGRSVIVLDGEWPVDTLAGLAEQLLDEYPGLTMVVTARRPTGLPMEALLRLEPLATVPDGAAVQMFLSHVERLRPSFRRSPQNAGAVLEICEAVDGIPAALECAARWSVLYSPLELARLLRQDPLLVSTPPGGSRHLFTSVRRSVAGLTARQRRLLTIWYEHACAWTVAEAAAVVGVALAECADDVFTLMTLGLLRRREDGDRVAFEALRFLRSFCIDSTG